jgi:hypothetical protein
MHTSDQRQRPQQQPACDRAIGLPSRCIFLCREDTGNPTLRDIVHLRERPTQATIGSPIPLPGRDHVHCGQRSELRLSRQQRLTARVASSRTLASNSLSVTGCCIVTGASRLGLPSSIKFHDSFRNRAQLRSGSFEHAPKNTFGLT